MTKEKIILSVLGLVVFASLFYVAVNFDYKSIRLENNVEELPSQPIRQNEEPVRSFPGNNIDFNRIIILKAKDSVVFPDGLKITLNKIDDSRCPSGAQCIWAGEISGSLAVSGGKITGTKEIRLGTLNNKNVNDSGYVFSLKNAGTKSLSIMVTKTNERTISKPCYIGGCSSQICSNQKEVFTTCEYREVYACYKTAKCERQATGQCGWTETPELLKCLSNDIRN